MQLEVTGKGHMCVGRPRNVMPLRDQSYVKKGLERCRCMSNLIHQGLRIPRLFSQRIRSAMRRKIRKAGASVVGHGACARRLGADPRQRMLVMVGGDKRDKRAVIVKYDCWFHIGK